MVITQRRPVSGDQSVMISQNGAQMEPKLSPLVLIWSTNGAQWSSSGAQMEPNGAQKEFKWSSNGAQWSFNGASMEPGFVEGSKKVIKYIIYIIYNI